MTTSDVGWKYDEGEETTDAEARNNPKISYHASGIINAPGQRFLADPLRALTQQTDLLIVTFLHPTVYDAISDIRPRDICLEYPIDEQRPFWLRVEAGPAGTMEVRPVPLAIHREYLSLQYTNLEDCQDLAVMLVISHGPIGPWPRAAGISWRGQPA